MQLTEHFSLEELTFTQHRELDNTPPTDVLEALHRTAEGLERVRALLGKPVLVTSGYRSPELNRKVGGQPNSQHCRGEAADFICPGFGSPAAVAQALAAQRQDLGIDQLILEFGSWAHVSFAERPRYALLTIDRAGVHQGIV